jgi:hypothetical protein
LPHQLKQIHNYNLWCYRLNMDSQESRPGCFISVDALDKLLDCILTDWMDGQEWIQIPMDGLKRIHRVILEVLALYMYIDALGKLTELNSLYLS